MNRVLRTIAQLVVALPITALVNQLADGLTPEQLVAVQAVATAVVTILQNFVEDRSGKSLPGPLSR